MKRSTLHDLAGQVFDLAIIGGGITGAAAARDAALRGLSVALFEKHDFASGTSSRSTKLLHGGLRYLQSYQFRLVREACRERELMLRLAPHLAHVRPFIYLIYAGYPESMALLNLGLTVYDLFSGSPLKRRHRMLDRRALLDAEPHLNRDGLIGGGRYYDFLTDDARLTLDTLKGAVEAGAKAANYMEVTGLVWEGGRVAGVEVADRIAGGTATVRARQVINAGGVWVDQVRALEEGARGRMLRPTKGIHIVLRKADFPLNHAVFLRSPRDNRVVWPIPALDEGLVYIGTTDTDYQGPLDHVTATPEDVDYLLEVANHTIPDARVGHEHIVGTWAGLRPLIRPEGDRAASAVSREHQIVESPGGLLTIAGGKLTTARVMAQQVVDAAVRRLAERAGLRGVPASRTARVPLSGGAPEALEQARRVAGSLDVAPGVRERWLGLYGGNLPKLAAIAAADPAAAQDLGCHHLTLAEVRHAVQEEMALTVSDFFVRRAAVFYWADDGGMRVAEAVADEMARLLGWDEAERRRQLAEYRAWVAANRFTPVAT